MRKVNVGIIGSASSLWAKSAELRRRGKHGIVPLLVDR